MYVVKHEFPVPSSYTLDTDAMFTFPILGSFYTLEEAKKFITTLENPGSGEYRIIHSETNHVYS